VRRVAIAALTLLAAASTPTRADDAVDVAATLHLRTTSLGNPADGRVLYDPAAQSFALTGYLLPGGGERFASGFASIAIDGRHLDGDLRWAISLDTGELRRRAFPEVVPVCLSTGETGLATPSAGTCRLYATRDGLSRAIVPLESTASVAPELTSNGRSVHDELARTVFLRETYAAATLGRAGFATIRAGRMRLTVADGFVYDDYATGAEAALDLGAIGPPIALSAAVFEPSRDFPRNASEVSPMLAVRADWLPSLFEHVGVFLAVHRDRAGGMGELLRDALVERLATEILVAPAAEQRAAAEQLAMLEAAPAESEATLAWLGTSGSVVPWRGQRISWTGALLRGRVDRIEAAIQPDPTQAPVTLANDLELEGHLASLCWEVDLRRRLTARASFLLLSGGALPPRVPGSAAPLTGTYRGFIGVAPFVTNTNLFFGGGLSESFADRRATAPGVNGRGVLAPGLSLGWDVRDDVGVLVSGTWLRADAPGPYGGLVYGTEIDVEVTWQLARWLQLGAEADALFPGDFFPGDRTMTKVVLALDLIAP
jgi:hypothetical protein